MKRLLQAVVGFAISAGALWLTLRGKDLSAIWAAIRSANYLWLLPYVGILTLIHLVRTYRWGILLEPVAKVPFGKLNAASAVGFMALMILPFRLGEFARPYLIAERPRLRVSAALSSVVVERVADGLFTAALLVVTLLAVPEGTPGLHFLRAGGVAVFLAFAGLLVFLVLANRNRTLAVRLTHRILDPISPRVAERVSGMMDAFIHGLRLVPSRGKVALFFLLTAVYWGLNGFGMQILARGFDIHFSALAAFTVLGVLVVGVMIPAGPGMVGTFQAATILGMALFLPKDVVDTRGAAYANVLWAAQLAQQTALGLFFLFSRHIRIANIVAAPEEVEEELEEEAHAAATPPGDAPANGNGPR
ncbi:MAG TPA: lysylphosphatidylglycerol synthase transmembrane domain-containing protein [Anaeromyxobacteraceae bacterium]|nr:lysylphosphatidylglycerol synthase transmembrane domain-containing protein [Anaeromyxobacteraceae bacterium]